MQTEVTAGVHRTHKRVLMSLNPEYYRMLWKGLKRHEFRRRYLRGCSTTWYVYLNAPVSRLAAAIELGSAIVNSPHVLAELAEQDGAGTGQAVLAYLKDEDHAFALPIRTVCEYEGLSAAELAAMLDGFQPPRGYTLIDEHPGWARVCDQLTATRIVRQLVVQDPSSSA